MELTRIPMIAWHRNGTIIQWSKGSEALYGYTQQEAVGRQVHELLKSKPSGTSLEAVEKALARNGVWMGKITRSAKNGRQVSAEARWEVLAWDGSEHILEKSEDSTTDTH